MGFGTDLFPSVRAVAVILKYCGHQKTTHTTQMRHTHKVMMLFFSSFQRIDQNIHLVNSHNQYLYSYLANEKKKIQVIDGKGACFGVFCRGRALPGRLQRPEGHGVPPYFGLSGIIQTCMSDLAPKRLLVISKYQIHPSEDKDLLAGRIFKRIR